MEKNNAKHLGILVVGMATVGAKTFPTLFTKDGGRDTWIAAIAAAVLLLAAMLYMVWVCQHFSEMDVYRVFTTATGRWVGSALYFLYLLTILLTIIESLGVEANVMHTAFLDKDPILAFLLFSVLAGLFVVLRKGTAVTITAMVTLICISVSGVILFILTMRYKEVKYLFPILEDGVTPGLGAATLKLLGAYSSAAMVLPYLFSLKNGKKLMKSLAIGLFFLVQIEIVSMVGVLMTFTIERLDNLIFPKLTQTQLVSYFGFLEAGELFVMLQIVAGWFIQYVLAFYALLQGAERIHIKGWFLPIGVCALAFAAAYFASQNLFRLFAMLEPLVWLQLVGFIVIPVSMFAVYHLKRRRQGNATVQSAAAQDAAPQ